MRDKIGIIWDYNESIDKTLEKYKNQNFNKDNHIFNIGKSDEVGALYIKDLVKEFIS